MQNNVFLWVNPPMWRPKMAVLRQIWTYPSTTTVIRRIGVSTSVNINIYLFKNVSDFIFKMSNIFNSRYSNSWEREIRTSLPEMTSLAVFYHEKAHNLQAIIQRRLRDQAQDETSQLYTVAELITRVVDSFADYAEP